MGAATGIVQLAKGPGLALTGPVCLPKQLTKTVVQTALNEKMMEHLGYEKVDRRERYSGQKVAEPERHFLIDSVRLIEIDVPRDWVGAFEEVVAGKR